MASPKRHALYLEVAAKRTFAGSIEWPGWTRGGRTEADALDALLAYGRRYATVVGPTFAAPQDVAAFEVAERLRGGATTEFGAPGEIPEADSRALGAVELERQLRLLERAWQTLDAAADAARSATLRTGPRGGGRDLLKIIEHVTGAELSYLSKLGARYDGPANDQRELRNVVRQALAAAARDEPIANPSAVTKRWPPRYFVRRAAWHVLDHAWEIDDRAS